MRWDENNDENLFPNTEGDDEGDEVELSIEYIKVLEKRQLIEAAKLELAQKDINYAILAKTIAYLKKSWFWRFKSEKKKLSLIVETYQTFKALVDIEEIEQEESAEESGEDNG